MQQVIQLPELSEEDAAEIRHLIKEFEDRLDAQLAASRLTEDELEKTYAI